MSFGETLHRPALRTSERDRRCSQRANLQMSSILGIVLISVCALFIPNSSKRRLGYSPEPVVEGASRWSSERRTLPEHMLQRRGHKGFRPIFDSFTSAVGGGISGRPAYESTRDATRTGKAFAKAGGASGDAVSNKSTSRTTRGRPETNITMMNIDSAEKSVASLHNFKGTMMAAFHEGVYKLQKRYYGYAQDPQSHPFRIFMPQQHVDFYNKLPFVVLAGTDKNENAWVSVVTAEPGKSLMEATHYDITFGGIDKLASHGDPLLESLEHDEPVGLLGIELHTRRRNRLNGVANFSKDGLFRICGPLLSFGNCPQYITERNWKFRPTKDRKKAQVKEYKSLSSDHQRLIGDATTFFMSTGHPETGMDASHRGGPKGFVRIIDDNTLMYPDFPGNRMLKSLGNIEANGKLGLWFGDFENGLSLQLTGSAKVVLCDTKEGKETIASLKEKAQSKETALFPDNFNWVIFKLKKAVERTNGLSVMWESRHDYIDLTVSKIVDETKDIKSFYLSRSDKVVQPIPGQYLPIFVNPPEHAYKRGDNIAPLDRTYTISGFGPKHYRLSIKKVDGGKVSSWFHTLKPGSIIQSREPQGHFTLKTPEIPPSSIIFISGGIGVTPLVPILSDAVKKYASSPKKPKIFWIYTTQNAASLPKTLHEEVNVALKAYNEAKGTAISYVQFSREENTKALSEGKHSIYKQKARLSQGLLQDFIKSQGINKMDAHVYACGPSGLMSMLGSALSGYPYVFTESFGPSAAPKKK
eukprot:CAMPEP_0167740172 /NCGR_PEP_ID=MMETSP0110_2-20121227/123_1 /TAXON_ID=629695 /ORGANISM="Gymnochlora sp., Strain CCMP2014" /LENGTH=754 /DNA_ID=CAMNT_0007624023 /DNA_START=1968 /DNA_END=4232 /DNA_ORIENTATION=-